MMLEEKKAEAQQALDELFRESLLPFELHARKISSIGLEEYIIYFYDSRLHSIDITWCQAECFKNVVRAAVLERIGRLNVTVHSKRVRIKPAA